MGSVIGITRAGRPSLPTATKELRGTLEKSRLNPDEPKLDPVKIGKPPKGLGPAAVDVWHELAPLVDEQQAMVLGIITAAAMALGHLSAIHKLLAQTGRLGRNVTRGVVTPAQAEGRQPATCAGLEIAAQAKGVGAGLAVVING